MRFMISGSLAYLAIAAGPPVCISIIACMTLGLRMAFWISGSLNIASIPGGTPPGPPPGMPPIPPGMPP
eukprot:CAMPEP_0181334388 /NCGR_PEP_ID=MMETSP1101-20121128/26226_1 /TAXON_ID=46948 /ORGANISM="Rhodomonas abbreviata, Strain Caron Lab Isolate" /LENGTH=68 /DNA_ID=CAMNT_0023444347 /DNA_START=30 /DNA_END=233 /DNA_ORIENTATION=+